MRVEKLVKMINSPELKAMGGLIVGFAKRRGQNHKFTKRSSPLLNLEQAELVDGVWKGNNEIISKYQGAGVQKKPGHIKTSSSSSFSQREVVRHDQIFEKITFKNLSTRIPGSLLNDEVINAYLRLVDTGLEI